MQKDCGSLDAEVSVDDPKTTVDDLHGLDNGLRVFRWIVLHR